jgi:hypothetical protein
MATARSSTEMRPGALEHLVAAEAEAAGARAGLQDRRR